MLLDGKKLLITGVLTKDSIAAAVARLAQEQGAELVLTSFGRGMRLTERVARTLPSPPDVVELDVTDAAHHAALADELGRRWGKVDGALHAVGFAPGGCWRPAGTTSPLPCTCRPTRSSRWRRRCCR